MNTHQITLETPQGTVALECPEETFILDQAARQGLQLPAVCRGGACSSCVGRLLEGAPPDQSEQTYLSPSDVEQGFVLLCVASPRGACRISTHQASQYLASLNPNEH